MSDDHPVIEHWDDEGGDVLYRTCSCGEQWTRDEEVCPEADDPDESIEGRAVVPLEALIANFHAFGKHWSWRCGLITADYDERQRSCRYDHTTSEGRDAAIREAVQHLAEVHGVKLIGELLPDVTDHLAEQAASQRVAERHNDNEENER